MNSSLASYPSKFAVTASAARRSSGLGGLIEAMPIVILVRALVAAWRSRVTG